ncbi:MAG: putative porin [Chitinophagaceae bacterium]|nr:putative porin [Chitinophagaceae bacterium]
MHLKGLYHFSATIIVLLFFSVSAMAQLPRSFNSNSFNNLSSGNNANTTTDSQGRIIKRDAKKDSLQHRDQYADSITIYYRYFDSTRNRIIDSSVSDYYSRLPMGPNYHTLGTYGSAAQSYFFNPLMKAGWDPGLHQFDPYKFTLENTKFYQTTRPYSEMAYLLGSKSEQLISILLTQNKKSNFNYSFEYLFSSTPGYLKTQNNSHNSFRITAHYQTKNKHYESFFIFLSNKTAASENGGLQDSRKLDSLSSSLNDPYSLETRLGKAGAASRNPFNTTVNTGNTYKELTLLYKHHYDLGKKDSIVTDSIVRHIFYPRFRIEHILRYTQNSYSFSDITPDSIKYANYFNFNIPNNPNGDTIAYKDSWKEVNNEFSLISFPDKNNLSQFFKVGAALQNLSGVFDTVTGKHSFYNLYGLVEYRNRTRNQKWDMEASGQLYLNGLNSGDYAALVSMKRLLGSRIGSLNIGFQNVNRSPAFIFDPLSSFPLKNRTGFNKENLLRFFLQYENPKIGWKLNAEYFAVSNYIYFDSFFTAKQEATLFNVLHLSAEKKFKLSRNWYWYTDIHLQQTTGGPPVNLPFLYTRNRIAFEGNFFTNLFIATGLEIKYHSPYKADNYSPFLGQFFYQNAYTVNNRPDIAAYLNFRIKSFKTFLRLENLNALSVNNGFKFDHRNFAVEQYPYAGLWVRFGIWWNFVN